MRVIFAGTPEFASVTLEALINSSHEVVAVYTQPDRPSGRGLKLKQSSVKEVALQYQLPLYQPASLKDEEEKLKSLNADVMVVSAYGLLIPANILRLFPYGCVNIHPSLLPRWRGAAPIARAIYAGDTITGVTIMQMDQGLDTGPILLQRQYVMEADETSQSLHDKLAKLGATALIETLDLLALNKIKALPQDNQLATYANKVSKEEALIDWHQEALELEHEIRAFNPWPVAHTSWQGHDLRIWEAKAVSRTSDAKPRTIVHVGSGGIDIATGGGILRLLKVQLPGGKIISVSDFYNGRRNELVVGQSFI